MSKSFYVRIQSARQVRQAQGPRNPVEGAEAGCLLPALDARKVPSIEPRAARHLHQRQSLGHPRASEGWLLISLHMRKLFHSGVFVN